MFTRHCSESPATKAVATTSEEYRTEVVNVSQAYFDAVEAVDAEEVVSYWIKDLKFIQHSGADILGKVAFKEFLDSSYPTLQVYRVEIGINEIEAYPTFATQTVQFSEELSIDGGERPTIRGRYFAVRKNLPEQGWKTHRMVALPSGADPIHNASAGE